MLIFRSNRFARKFKKLPLHIREKFEQRLDIFIHNKYDPILRLHKLKGDYHRCISIDILPDVRLILECVSPEVYKMRDIGTHSELYE